MDSIEIKDLTLYKTRQTFWRLDVAPFQILYISCLFAPDFTSKIVCIILVALLQILCFLFGQWFVDFHCFVASIKVDEIAKATHVKVTPNPNKGKKELCAIVHALDENDTHFTWQKRKFIYSPEKKQFRKLDFPVHLTFGDFLSRKGCDEESSKKAMMKWGPNKFEIPMPTFSELYKEQAVAPFFVFQIFCVLLWCLDEYWYYSLFTLFLLLMFEATVVKSRLRNLTALRNMSLPPRTIQVFRGKRWVKLSTGTLHM